MAFHPCMAGPHYNPAKNFLVYVGLMGPQELQRYRLRFCRNHFGAIQEDLAEFKVSPEDGTVGPLEGPSAKCLACGKPASEVDWQLFVTCYPTQHEREDYWSRLHVNCRLPTWYQDLWVEEDSGKS